MTFDSLNYDGTATAESDGFALSVKVEPDSDGGLPWENSDGHGPVSDWTRRDKRAGELILSDDRGSKRYYDFAEACRIARRDGWDAAPYSDSETAGQRAAKAAMADYNYLKSWCDDRWHYVGVIVTASKDGIELGSASLWGIESEAGDYFLEVANQLAPEALTEARATLAKLCACEATA